MSEYLTFPGLIDCHVHFREPGYEHKATMASEAVAARAGGVTTVCDMPNTNPATTSISALQDKVERASKITNCDIRFYFGATEQEHLDQLKLLWTDPAHAELKARCCGLKLYFDHSTGNQKANGDVLSAAFALCKELDIQIIAHCEDPAINQSAARQAPGTDVGLHSLQRPVASEIQAIQDALQLVRTHGTHFHVAHLSTGGGLDLVRAAKQEGLPVTCEVAPHHLFLNVDDYARLGTFGKMNPPLRTKEESAALWTGIHDGTVDCIATDHAPHTKEEKQTGEPLQAPSGVPGVETLLPLLLTAAHEGMIPYEKITELCFTNPNRIFRLGKSVSETQVIVDPAAEWTITANRLYSKCGWTPYEGTKVIGRVVEVR